MCNIYLGGKRRHATHTGRSGERIHRPYPGLRGVQGNDIALL